MSLNPDALDRLAFTYVEAALAELEQRFRSQSSNQPVCDLQSGEKECLCGATSQETRKSESKT